MPPHVVVEGKKKQITTVKKIAVKVNIGSNPYNMSICFSSPFIARTDALDEMYPAVHCNVTQI